MNNQIREGYDAFFAGKKPHHNPYAKDSRKWKDWIIGYESAKEESSD